MSNLALASRAAPAQVELVCPKQSVYVALEGVYCPKRASGKSLSVISSMLDCDEVPMVGRDEELQQLQHELEEVITLGGKMVTPWCPSPEEQHGRLIVVEGDTGCGKTTQVPQYVLEEATRRHEPVYVMCTQPRRISAMGVAARVAEERGEELGATVGYSIRLETKAGAKTQVSGVPRVTYQGQLGLQDVVLDLGFASNARIWLTYAEPATGGQQLAVARATLVSGSTPRLDDVTVVVGGVPTPAPTANTVEYVESFGEL